MSLLDDYDKIVKREGELRREIAEYEAILAMIVEEKTKLRDAIEAHLRGDASEEAPQQPSLPLDESPVTMGMYETTTAVRELGGLVDARALAEKMRLTQEAAAIRLNRAAAKGLIVRVKRGKYRFPYSGEDEDERSSPHDENHTPT